MDFIINRRTVKAIRSRIFWLAFGSPQKIIVSGMVIAIALSMGVMGASGNLFQPIPSNSPYTTHPTFSVIATPDAVHVGEITNITASVVSYVHDSSIDVNISVVGPDGMGAVSYETATIFTNSHGRGNVTIQFPTSFSGQPSTSIIGVYTVVATFAEVYTPIFAYNHFIVYYRAQDQGPEILMTPGFGPAGTSVVVDGYHFAPSSNITLYYDGSQVTTTPLNAETNSTGFFSLNFTAPQSTGINSVIAQDQSGNNASSFFRIQPSSQPGPNVVSSTSSPIVNGSAMANFMSTVGVRIILTGLSPSNATHSSITASVYDRMEANATQPSIGKPIFYDMTVLNVTGGNAIISISNAKVNSNGLNAMQYWNGKSWVSASFVSLAGNTITGVIPINDLGANSVVIGYSHPPSHISEYAAILVIFGVAAIAVPIIIRKRGK